MNEQEWISEIERSAKNLEPYRIETNFRLEDTSCCYGTVNNVQMKIENWFHLCIQDFYNNVSTNKFETSSWWKCKTEIEKFNENLLSQQRLKEGETYYTTRFNVNITSNYPYWTLKIKEEAQKAVEFVRTTLRNLGIDVIGITRVWFNRNSTGNMTINYRVHFKRRF